MIVPVQMPVSGVTVSLVPQLNLLADTLTPADRHIEFQGVVNLTMPIAPRITLAGELWTSQNCDPSGTVRQFSADPGLSCLLSDELQLDIGGNFGLNQTTPGVKVHAGVSARF